MKLVIEFDENPLVASRYWERRRIDGRSKKLLQQLLSLSSRPTTSRVSATILLADQ